jgi:ferredoxin
MPRLRVDGREVEVPAGGTVLDAARAAGASVPTMCFLAEFEPTASCMICSVRDVASGRTIPACSARAVEGMDLVTDDAGLRLFRRTAVELLLAEHLGDCEGPCRGACPAHMDIPLMIRQIRAGRLEEAAATVRRDIPFPAILGRICPAPCEQACRRALHDQAVSICMLKRFVADRALAAGDPRLPERGADSGRRVGIVGAGPAGLAAAWYLLQAGHACEIFDDRSEPGGGMRWGVGEERLPAGPRDAEIAAVARLGAELHLNVRVGRDLSVEELRSGRDAVIVAAGERPEGEEGALDSEFGLERAARGIKADPATLATGARGVFACGGSVRPGRSAVRALAAGRRAARSVDLFVRGLEPFPEKPEFNSRLGKLLEGEMAEFLKSARPGGRTGPAGGTETGLSEEEALAETRRCLGCDCLAKDNCRLRDCASACGVRRSGRNGESRATFVRVLEHPEVAWEPGKCIRCGLCVRAARRAGEDVGLTLLGRGFETRLGVPFGGSLAAALKHSGADCARVCPTGALALKPDGK